MTGITTTPEPYADKIKAPLLVVDFYGALERFFGPHLKP